MNSTALHDNCHCVRYLDLILVPISYPVTDIPRIDSFGYKARQKDEVQNCVLLTSAAYALQEDVQG